MGDPAPPLAQTATWWLRVHSQEIEAKKLWDLMMTSHNAWVTNEAILALGRQGKAEVVPKLFEILCAAPGADIANHQRALPAAWNDLEGMHLNEVGNAKAGNAGLRVLAGGGQNVTIGVPMIYLARMRASAAIALGGIDTPESRKALVAVLKGNDDSYSDVYKDFAIMSLGRIADREGLAVLVDILRRGHCSSASDVRPQSPLRGFAALALGLYGRPVATPQGPSDRADYDKASQLLGERMADGKETSEVRAACAVGLGLTGRTENLKYLQPASGAIGGDDDLLIGYTILARGLVGDKNIIGPARAYLDVKRDKSDLAGVMGRRAAVMGLGCLGSQEAIPVLLDAWHLSYHVNRETTVALAMCQAYNTTDDLLKLMKEAKNPWERAFAARSLGELLAKSRPQRAAALVEGSNYTLRDDSAMRYKALGNEFLYLFLLPAFGSDWK